MITSQYKDFLIAILISLILTTICFFFFYRTESIPGTLYVISVLSRFTIFILGVLLFIFRISGFLRRECFIYIFLGVLNMWLSMIFLYIYVAGQPNKLEILEFLPNLLLGALLLIDVYWTRPRRAKTKSL